MQVEAFEAVSSAAYGALWHLLADLDLSHRVVAARRPGDEPLRWMLVDPRALRVTRSADNLWLRLIDVGAALEARTYPAAASLVLDVHDAMLPENQGRWRLDATPTGTTCQLDPGANRTWRSASTRWPRSTSVGSRRRRWPQPGASPCCTPALWPR